MKKQSDKAAVKEDEKYVMKGEIKYDNRTRGQVFEVKHNGVTVEWTANVSEALAAHKAAVGSVMYTVNLGTGAKTRHA